MVPILLRRLMTPILIIFSLVTFSAAIPFSNASNIPKNCTRMETATDRNLCEEMVNNTHEIQVIQVTQFADIPRNDSVAWFPPELPSGMIVLISFACIVTVIAIVLGALYCVNRSKVRALRAAKLARQQDMLHRLNQKRLLPLIREPDSDGNFIPPVICSICNVEMKHVEDLCLHYGRLLQYFTDNDYLDRVKRSAKRVRLRNYNSNITIDIDELLKTDKEFENEFRRWRSMDMSLLSMHTAMTIDNSVLATTNNTIHVDVSEVSPDGSDSENDLSKPPRSPPMRKFSPQIAVRHAASSISNFLTTEIIHPTKLSISSWRTPSPGKTSTPQRCPLPRISIGEPEDESPLVLSNCTCFTLSPSAHLESLTIPPKYRSA